MRSQIVTRVALGYKGTELYIFPCYLLTAHILMEYLLKFVVCRYMVHLGYALYLLPVHISLESPQHTIESHLCRIGNERENRMLDIIVYSLQYCVRKLLSKLFTFLVDVTVRTAAEVYTLERALAVTTPVEYLLDRTVTVFIYNQCMSRLKFMYVVTLYVECGLKNGALARKYYHLFVLVPESRTYAPWVSYGEHLAASGKSAHHISAVKVGHGCLKYVGYLYVVFYIVRYCNVLQSAFFCFNKVTLHFPVQTMPHQLQCNIAVAVYTGILSLLYQLCKNLIYIGHIEISAQTEVLGTPVVASQKRMYIRKTTLSGS